MKREMIVALHETNQVGWQTIQVAVSKRLWTKPIWQESDMLSLGIRPAQAAAIHRRLGGSWQEKAAEARPLESVHTILTPLDADYPDALRQIDTPPWVLYADGNLDLLKRPQIAIVGTRSPTAYGRQTARMLAGELASAGVTIVSGMALGIDGICHEAALEHIGGTIAVLPTPINVCYPSSHRGLWKKVREQGLLLSETPPGTALHKGQFVYRNRIIAGLSSATIVVEGRAASGSLITARHTLEMNRELFAVPGPLQSPKSQGPNQLIKDTKARLLTETADVFAELPWLREQVNLLLKEHEQIRGAMQQEKAVMQKQAELVGEEAIIIALLQDQPLSINDLHQQLAIEFGHLSILLLNLCIKRKIELQPGGVYIAL